MNKWQIEKKVLRKLKKLEEFKKDHPYMWNIPHEVGNFLNLLIKSTNRKEAIEVGTSNGYSTIWLAEALAVNEGQITTVERVEEKIKLAKENIREVDLESVVDIKEGSAQDILPKLNKTYDFAFIDADKHRYVNWLEILEAKLKVGAIIVADNRDAYRGVKSYLKYLNDSPKFSTFRTQIRKSQDDALEVSWKIRS